MLAVTGSLPLKAPPTLPVCTCAPTFADFPSLHPLDCFSPIHKFNISFPVTRHTKVCFIFTFPPCAVHTLVSSLPATPPAFPFISLWDYRHATPTEPSLWESIHKDFLPRRPVCNMITVGPANAALYSPRVHNREKKKVFSFNPSTTQAVVGTFCFLFCDVWPQDRGWNMQIITDLF